MSRKLTVLLLEDVASLGKAGDIVTVSEGYARNSLFPEGRGALAGEKAHKQAEARRAALQAESNRVLAQAQALAEKLEGTELTLKARRKADEGGEIYGTVTARHVADELNRAAQLSLKPKDIKLKQAITRLGGHDILVSLSPEVEIKIHVTVSADEKS